MSFRRRKLKYVHCLEALQNTAEHFSDRLSASFCTRNVCSEANGANTTSLASSAAMLVLCGRRFAVVFPSCFRCELCLRFFPLFSSRGPVAMTCIAFVWRLTVCVWYKDAPSFSLWVVQNSVQQSGQPTQKSVPFLLLTNQSFLYVGSTSKQFCFAYVCFKNKQKLILSFILT